MGDHSNDDLISEIPNTAGARYADENGRPVYGGIAQSMGADGRYVQGSSAAEIDEDWYRRLAMRNGGLAPQIDRTQEVASRDMGQFARNYSVGEDRNEQWRSVDLQADAANGRTADQQLLRAGATGGTTDTILARDSAAGNTEDMRLLGSAARGDAPSKAEILGQQMSDRALRSQVSAAGNVRGGPGAGASAFRAATQNAMTQRADMNMGIQAERADEMAQARGAYSGALGLARKDYGNLMGANRREFGAQAGAARRDYNAGVTDLRHSDDMTRDMDLRTRDQDIRLASDQAHLQAGQRSEDAANERYYVGLDNSTKFGVMGADASAVDAAARARQQLKENQFRTEAADMAKLKDTAALSSSIGSSVVSAGQMSQMSQNSGGGGGGGSSGPGPNRGDTSSYDSSSGIYRGDPYSDVATKEPIQWGSLAATGGASEADRPKAANAGRFMYSDDEAKEKVAADAFRRGVEAGASQKTAEPGAPGSVKAGDKSNAKKADALANNSARSMGLSMAMGPHLLPITALGAAATAYGVGRESHMPDSPLYGVGRDGPGRDRRTARKVEPMKRGISYASDSSGYSMPDGAEAPEPDDDPPTKADETAASALAPDGPHSLPPPRPPAVSNEYVPASFAPGVARQPTSFARDGALASFPPVDPNAAKYNGGPLTVRTGLTGDRGASLSDEKTKEKFGTMPDDAMADAARSMTPSPYAYKPQYVGRSGQSEGEVNVGPMANAMAKDPVASTAISKDPDTGLLMIDKDKGLKLTMGSLASMQHQIDEMKRGRRGESAKR